MLTNLHLPPSPTTAAPGMGEGRKSTRSSRGGGCTTAWTGARLRSGRGQVRLPSGKHTKNDGKSSCLMGKLTISTGPFSIAMLNYQRVWFMNVYDTYNFIKQLIAKPKRFFSKMWVTSMVNNH